MILELCSAFFYDPYIARVCLHSACHSAAVCETDTVVFLKALRQEHTCPTIGCLKHLERPGRDREKICLVCSAALGALSAPIQHSKSEEVGCRPSEPLDTLIGGVLANQRSVCTLRKKGFIWVLYLRLYPLPKNHLSKKVLYPLPKNHLSKKVL